jgi:valyl-tRNA synthetase
MADELSTSYDPAETEPLIYDRWIRRGCFHAEPDDRPPDRRYTIMMPLPNVTGALHMGHAIDNCMQDLLIRWHRMLGDNTLWMAGTDHAGIATQAVVEKRLFEEEGKTRHDLGREGLLERIWAWKEEYQARIYAQLKRMGCSCDWDRVRFTMDEICTRAVRHTFFRMFKDGYIYRGKRLVNWDVALRTAVADDELVVETVEGKFWHVRYPLKDPAGGDPAHLIVATTRPETMLGDTAVAVNPSDNRYRNLVGKTVVLPLLEREIPIVGDEWADPELGSGCVKITPAHDPNDYDVGLRRGLEMINILNPDGTINENGGPYAGLDRFDARKKVVADLESRGLIEQVEDRQMEVKHSDRSKTPIEPYLSDQWFVKMDDLSDGSPGFAQLAIDAVEDGRVRFHPERYAKTYIDWLAQKRDWCISRQLWWGHRIPVWSKRIESEAETAFIEAANPNEAHLVVREQDGARIAEICLLNDNPQLVDALSAAGFEQDEDVLDTWFSSALWPHSTLGWPDPESGPAVEADLPARDGKDNCLDFFYPTSCLVTGRDIITLWVAKMIITGLYNLGEVPFTDVYVHANIQDGNGKRMSKSAGNGLDPIDIIETYGTDAMRYTLAELATGTQDIRLPVTAVCPSCEVHLGLTGVEPAAPFAFECQKCGTLFDVVGRNSDRPVARLIIDRFDTGRNFCNKLWNAARFAMMNLSNVSREPIVRGRLAIEDRWILASLNRVTVQTTRAMKNYEFSSAVTGLREFFWSDLCDWYLELTKPRIREGGRSGAEAKQVLAFCLDQVLRMLHPFTPFITERLWGRLNEQAGERGLPGLADAPPSELLLQARWPEGDSSLDDEASLADFGRLQELTKAIRDLRSTHNVPPKQTVDVMIRCPTEQAERLREGIHVISSLVKIGGIDIEPDAQSPAGSAAAVLGEIKVFVLGVVDEAAQQKKLESRRQELKKKRDSLRKRLGDDKYVERAPKRLVDESRDQLEAVEAELTVLEEALSSA